MIRVLVVDDDITLRHLLVTQLDLLGVAADSAAGGMEAVRRVQEHDYELILLDCKMPDLDGRDATAAIRSFEKRNQKKPVAIVGITAAEDLSEWQAVGMQEAYRKPLLMDDVKKIVEKWLPGVS